MRNYPCKLVVAVWVCVMAAGCAPRVDGFSPAFGPPGTEVRVNGKRLISGGNASATAVALAGIDQVDIVSVTSSELRFRVSADAITGPIAVTTARGSDSSDSQFDVVADANDPDGAYTFGGVGTVQAVKVAPSETDQEVLIGVARAKWAPNSGNFAAFQPDVDAAFDRMNNFWIEVSFGRTSFQKQYLTNSVIDLPNSNDYYYHSFQQRSIRGFGLPADVDFPGDETLMILSDGQDIDVDFTAGSWALADIEAEVAAALANAAVDQPQPTFEFDLVGNSFRVTTTLTGETMATLELEGGALPFLGFGAESLYDLGIGAPMIAIFSQSLDEDDVTFAAAEQLTIDTQGATTTVDFAAGTFTVANIVADIEAAFPGDAQQQPFEVSSIGDPLDGGRRIIVFETSTAEDLGVRLMVAGSARATLGLQNAGVLRRAEPETFRGYRLILDAFNEHAASLPAGTDLDALFGDARMFVGYIVDNTSFRAHHSSWTFDIQGNDYEVNYFASRNYANLGPVFAHETGHALGLPDLYREEPWQLGTPPGNWDVMDCSFCDAHPVAWLKSRHHRAADDQAGPWVDNARIVELDPPPALSNRTDTVILTPVESPWISSNPFSASHPGVPVAHAVELIPTDPKDVFVVENRQVGIFTADHLGNQVDYSQSLPNEGVIMYEGRRHLSGIATFLPVNVLSPMANPLNNAGESLEHIITNLNKVTVTTLEKLTNPDASGGNPSFSYLTQITWGQGSFFDLAIRDWEPPPWESEDIWIDSDVENGWDVYTYHDSNDDPILNGDNVAVGRFNRLYARIRNLGDIDIVDDVEVIWRVAVPQMVGGDVETELGRVTIAGGVPANSSVITPPFLWRPTSSNEEHVCLRAEIITIPDELNGTLNNLAQENVTQWHSGDGSPFEEISFEVMTKNPFDDRTIQARLFVPEVPRGWSVTVEDVEFLLPPSGTLRQTVTVKPYAAVLVPTAEVKRRGYVEAFAANIEAQTHIGDQWIPFGGTTAIVHPVNSDSQIRLDRAAESTGGGDISIGGVLTSQGLQNPPLANRDVHTRVSGEEGEPVWVSSKTDSSGRFRAKIPPQFHGAPATIQSFFGGGRGIAPTKSVEAVFKIPDTQPE